MASLNKVILLGNLTRDIELRYTPNGKAVGNAGLAMNHRWKTEGGEYREEVVFIDVTFWGRTAENVAQYLKKGNPCLVEGRLAMETWDDKQTGQKRQRIKVVAEKVVFTGGNKSQGGESQQRQERQPAGAATQQRQDGGGTPDSDYAPQDADSDIPF